MNEKQKYYHKPVMLNEVTDLFTKIQPKNLLDLTFGGGGHTKHLLNHLPTLQNLYTLDRDPFAYEHACFLAKQDERVKPLKGKFSEILQLMTTTNGVPSLDGCLLDAGLSSIQLADAQRGFSLSRDGPLDMRMDDKSNPKQLTAFDVVNFMSEERLNFIIKRYGEEKMSRQISKIIVDHRNLRGNIQTTAELATVIASAFPEDTYRKDKLNRQTHVGTKTFQAIRIFVNDEMNELQLALDNIHKLLKPGGLAVIITFHSLEDRIVKRHFNDLEVNDMADENNIEKYSKSKKYSGIVGKVRSARAIKGIEVGTSVLSVVGLNRLVDRIKLEEATVRRWRVERRGVILPGEDEVGLNARARSAKMRYALKEGL